MTPYQALKAADPINTTLLVEVIGHIFAGDPGGIATWCRRVGCDPAEFRQTVHDYRTAIDRGVRTAHPELL